MTPHELLSELHRRGVELAADADGGMILFRPAERVTPELRSLLAEHKPALLAMLTAVADPAEREVSEAGAVPFALTPRRTASAVAAWLRAGAPLTTACDPVASGLLLLRLRRQWRRSASGSR